MISPRHWPSLHGEKLPQNITSIMIFLSKSVKNLWISPQIFWNIIWDICRRILWKYGMQSAKIISIKILLYRNTLFCCHLPSANLWDLSSIDALKNVSMLNFETFRLLIGFLKINSFSKGTYYYIFLRLRNQIPTRISLKKFSL